MVYKDFPDIWCFVEKQLESLKTQFDFEGLSKLKMIYQKTKIDSLGGWKGSFVITNVLYTLYEYFTMKSTRSHNGVVDKAQV